MFLNDVIELNKQQAKMIGAKKNQDRLEDYRRKIADYKKNAMGGGQLPPVPQAPLQHHIDLTFSGDPASGSVTINAVETDGPELLAAQWDPKTDPDISPDSRPVVQEIGRRLSETGQQIPEGFAAYGTEFRWVGVRNTAMPGSRLIVETGELAGMWTLVDNSSTGKNKGDFGYILLWVRQ